MSINFEIDVPENSNHNEFLTLEYIKNNTGIYECTDNYHYGYIVNLLGNEDSCFYVSDGRFESVNWYSWEDCEMIKSRLKTVKISLK